MKRIKIDKSLVFIAITVVCLAIIPFTSCESKQQRSARAKVLENMNIEEEMHDKYIDNYLPTGDTPYSDLYGKNPSCKNYGCSQISVRTPSDFDVLVTIKQNDKVVRHAYIRANDSYTFEMMNGTYQPFFYYGKGWNPEKVMKKTPQGELCGGFVEDESFGKDDPQYLENNILQYELILQQNGNFSTRPSNAEDAL
jgi:predicted nucleic acid binding AN1-type Zn finger protein